MVSLTRRSPARRSVPQRVQLAVAIVAGAALLLAPLSRYAAGALRGPTAAVAAVTLATLIAAAQRGPVHVGPRRKVNVGTAPEVAAVLLLPGPLALLTLAAGTLLGEAQLRARGVQRLFNTAVAILKALAGLLTFSAVLHLGPAAVTRPAAALAAAAALYASTVVFVRAMAAVQLRENPLRRAWAPRRELLVAEVALSLTGILAARAAVQDIWALVLLVGPAVVAQHALRAGVALEAQTRLALEELADIVDLRDHYTFEHSRRVAELARATARRLRLDHELVELITMAGRVHDVGKIGVKSSVLLKPDALTPAEWREMRTHPEVGARLIGHFPAFARGRELVLHHHERFDGSGYPGGLAGEQIPLGARVLAAADAWDALTSHRAYRGALDLEAARAIMHRGRGSQFDPVVLDAFLTVLAECPELATAAVAVVQDIDRGLGAMVAPAASAAIAAELLHRSETEASERPRRASGRLTQRGRGQ